MSTTAPIAAPPDYSLGADEAERRRLIAQCERFRPEAERLFDRIGVGPGWRALDMGCGPLGVLDVLAGRVTESSGVAPLVGCTGRVVGVDREPTFLSMADHTLRERGVGRVGLVEADATHTGLPTASFDLVHERLLLVNVPSPPDVVTEMARLARPGGYVAAQDVDWISWTCIPQHPDWDRLTTVAAAAWSGDVRTGRRLPALLRAAGLVDVEVDAHARVFRPGDPEHRLLLRFAEIHREAILTTGALPPVELDGCLRRLGAHLDDPDSFTLYATLVQAWGRKP